MGVMQSLFGWIFGGAREAAALGNTVRGVAEVFRPNATRRMELSHDAYAAAHATHGAEFAHARAGWFDAFVNGLNRLPRPMLALGTLALFVYAMVDPDGFGHRMRGLAEVPEPLWWLLGAVVSFYFGAREAFYLRRGGRGGAEALPATQTPAPRTSVADAGQPATGRNPALEAWQGTSGSPNGAAPGGQANIPPGYRP